MNDGAWYAAAAVRDYGGNRLAATAAGEWRLTIADTVIACGEVPIDEPEDDVPAAVMVAAIRKSVRDGIAACEAAALAFEWAVPS